MGHNEKIQLFEDKRIRNIGDKGKAEWYFYVANTCGVFSGTGSLRPVTGST